MVVIWGLNAPSPSLLNGTKNIIPGGKLAAPPGYAPCSVKGTCRSRSDYGSLYIANSKIEIAPSDKITVAVRTVNASSRLEL